MPRRRRGRRARLVVNGPARPGPGVRRRPVIESVLRRPSRPPCSTGSAQQGGPGGERDGLAHSLAGATAATASGSGSAGREARVMRPLHAGGPCPAVTVESRAAWRP